MDKVLGILLFGSILMVLALILIAYGMTGINRVGDDYCKSLGYDKGGNSFQPSPEGYAIVTCCDWDEDFLEYDCNNKLIEVNWLGERVGGAT